MQVQLDADTAAMLRFAARIMGTDPAKVVAHIVREWSAADGSAVPPAESSAADEVGVFCRYMHQRVEGVLHPDMSITVTSGELAGQNFKTPSAAAAKVVMSINKTRTSVHANGWRFWKQVSNGRPIDSLRS